MAWIPEAELKRLKQDIPLAALCASRVTLKKRGQDLVGKCPFHEDKTASLVVTPSKNMFHCFGCGAAGTPIDWVMQTESVSFRHAAEILRAGISGTATPKTVRKLPCPVDENADGDELLEQVSRYYAETLSESGEALDYLNTRGLDDKKLIEHFRLGYANRTLGLRLPLKNRKVGEQLRTNLADIGVIRKSGHEHLNGCIVVPFLDNNERAVELYGRKVGQSLRKGTALHLYLSGPHRGILNRKGVTDEDEVILCEAPLDALSIWTAGIKNVTSSFGAGVITEELFALLKSKRRVVIAFDSDDAGERGAKELAERLIPEDVFVSRVRFPLDLDANAMLTRDGPETLCRRVRSAEWMGGKSKAPASLVKAPTPLPTPTPREEPTPKSEPLPLAAEASQDAEDAEAKTDAATITETSAPRGVALDVDADKDEVRVSFAGRSYRVRGLQKNLAYNVMKVNVMASQGDAFHVDSFDLYAAKARSFFIKMTSTELHVPQDIVRRDVGRLLFLLEQRQDEIIKATLEPKESVHEMSADEEKEAMALLQNPNLLDQVLADFDAVGVVGEQSNKIVGYLVSISRKLKKPLAVVIQSSSAAGKSSLMDAVLSFVPDEEKVPTAP